MTSKQRTEEPRPIEMGEEEPEKRGEGVASARDEEEKSSKDEARQNSLQQPASKKRKTAPSSVEEPDAENAEKDDDDDSDFEVICLVDSQEPAKILKLLEQAQVRCERRPLPTFDYLWVARRKGHSKGTNDDNDRLNTSSADVQEYILGHGIERKEIHDLCHSLNAKTQATGLTRAVEQKIKMCYSGVSTKHYLVQGKLGSVYRHNYRFNQVMKRRIYANIKEMERDGFQVHQFNMHGMPDIINFLKRLHTHIQSQFDQHVVMASDGPLMLHEHYSLTYPVFADQAKWVMQVATLRKVIPALGEKKLHAILLAFGTESSFRSELEQLGHAAMIERLTSLKTKAVKGKLFLSKTNAEILLNHLLPMSSSSTAEPVHKATNKSSATAQKPNSRVPPRTSAKSRRAPPVVVSPELMGGDNNSTTRPGRPPKRALFQG